MKVSYDQKTKSRCLNLEIISFVPLQTNTLDLIKWLRKLVTQITWSELLVDERKHKCVISICSKHTMNNQNQTLNNKLVTLKNKLGLEDPTLVSVRNETHSESCAYLEAEEEEDIKSEVSLGNDQQPIKLQNSHILNDLSTKLSHLPSAQRES